MNSATERMMEDILEHERHLLRLVRFLAHRQALLLIEENLTKPIERRVYELSDGMRSSRDIEKAVSKTVTQRTVVTWWQKWRRLGLVEQSPIYSGRMRQLMPLAELGLTIEGGEEES